MPLVIANPRGQQDGSTRTQFTDTTNTTSVTYTYPTTQSSLIIENSGERVMYVTVGGVTNQAIQVDTKYRYDGSFTSFSIRSDVNSQEFIATSIIAAVVGSVKQVNGIAPDTNGNITIPVPQVDTSTLATKTEVNAVASGSPKGVYATLSALQTAFPTGNTNIYLVTGNVNEVESLNITSAPTSIGNITVTLNGVATNIAVTSGVKEVASLTVSAVPTVAGNVTVTLNGVATTIALDPATDTTTDLVSTKIRNTVYSTGAVTGGTASTVTFTAAAVGVKTDATYSAGSTGATGTMSTTTQGVDADTSTSVATKIRGTSFSGWTTGGTGTAVTFTATAAGVKTAPSYSAGSTGATGTMSVTTAGVNADGNWYYWNGSAWTTGGVYQSVGITPGSITPDETSFFVNGKNLFDKSTITQGYFVNQTNGTLASSASYHSSDYIKVTSNTQYAMAYTPASRIAFYDANKVFISGSSVITNPITTPANAVYVRFSFEVAKLDTQQFELGTSPTAYEAFNKLIPSELVKEKPFTPITLKQTAFATIGKNLFDKNEAVIGYFVNQANGTLASNASYSASGFIEVESSTEYTVTTGYHIAFYDINKAYISGNNQGSMSPTTYTTPANAKYLRVTIPTEYGATLDKFQVEKGNVATATEPYGYTFTRSLPAKRDLETEMVLPSKIYALVGQELNIYFDNIMNDKDTKYEYDVTCTIGGQFENYFRVNPTTAGSYPITITAYRDNIQRATVSSTIVVTASSVGNGVNKKMLVIGDSTTANGIAVSKLNANFNTDVMDITMLGARGTAPNNHEGISGWTVDFFRRLEKDAVTPDVNNFYNPATSSFDFSYYMTQRGYAGVDYVVINLGINDMFSPTDDTSLNTKITTVLADYQFLIDSIKTYNSAIKIGIAITIPPNYSQDAFGKAYQNGQTRWRYKRNNFLWVKALINYFKGLEASNIYLIPLSVNIDTKNNYGFETLPVNARNTAMTVQSPIGNGGVHPQDSGYWQIADVYWYFLKSFEV